MSCIVLLVVCGHELLHIVTELELKTGQVVWL